MTIEPLIRRDCPTVDAFAGVDAVETELLRHGFLAVVRDGTFHGLLVTDDIIERHHNLVIDCLRPKPVVDPDAPVRHAFELMKSHHLTVLPVLLDGRLLGVITQMAILEHLANTGEAFERQIADQLRELLAINEQLRREVQERTAAEARARAAKQANSTFLANISHEIRTPLHIVIGLSQILEERAAGMTPDQVTEQLHKIQAAGHHLLALISQMLDLSLAEIDQVRIHPEPCSPNRILETLTAIFQYEARRKGNRLDCAGDERIGMVLADSLRLRQVLLNLLATANHFTEEGEISLGARLEENRDGKTRIAFHVEDTGVGIPAGELATLFEPFGQGTPDETGRLGGIGLGLAFSRVLVERMGGRIQVESHPNEGSRFRFTLELTTVPGEEARHSMAPAASAQPTAFILLIEDDAMSRAMLEQMLTMDGHRVVGVEYADEAFEALARERFDLILTDLRMPDIDGMEVIRQVRAMADPDRAATPILVLTADAAPQRLAAALEAGANAVMTKPMELRRLRQVMARIHAGETFADDRERPREHETNAAPLLDTEVLTHALQSLGRERVERICRQFPASSARMLAFLQQGLEGEDREAMALAAHRFAGSATHLGMRMVVALAREIEEQARLLPMAAVARLVRQFQQAVADSQTQLDCWLTSIH
ncbi:MAG: response regulator [Magnetococcales bacterium]|nr:response regulator [Magnetococcales bacterium]